MESLLQKLVSIVFECDRQGIAGNLIITTDLNTVQFYLEDGFLVDSSLKGPGQTLFDFLLSTGRINPRDCEQILRRAKEENTPQWVALLRGEWMSEAELMTARYQLAAQRFSLLLPTNYTDVQFEAAEHSGVASRHGAQGAVYLLLEVLRIGIDTGKIQPFIIPPYAVVRPTDRLKKYLENLRSIIPGPLPLPVVGGETYESLEAKYGHPTIDFLSILLLSGMIKTEIEEMETAGLSDVKIERLYGLVRRMAVLTAREIIDEPGGAAEQSLETGNLLLEGFSAFDLALQYYKRVADAVREDDYAAERRLLLSFMGGRAAESKLEALPLKISSLPSGRDTKAALLRHLAIHYFFHGKIQEAARCVHEAFIYKPYDFENLALFVQFFGRTPEIVLEVEGTKGLEIESFKEGEYPEVLPLTISCAKENGQFELISWIMKEAIEKVQISSHVFDLAVDIMRQQRWGPDLVEFITHFSLSSDRKGWTNPLWSLGALYSSEKIEDTLGFAREAYEILIRTSSGKLWAFNKLIDIMEKISQPNMMLELLEASFRGAADPQQKVVVGERMARLLVEEFGELREAGEVASRVVEVDAGNEWVVKIILQALADKKLGLSGCLRFVRAMLQSDAAASGPRLVWFREAAGASEDLLGAPDLAAALLGRIIAENPGTEDADVLIGEKDRIERGIADARAALAELKPSFGGAKAAARDKKIGARPQEAVRLLRLMVQTPEERGGALPLATSLFRAGVYDWDACARALVLSEDDKGVEAFVKDIAGLLPENLEEKREAVTFVEELSAVLKQKEMPGDETAGRLRDKLNAVLIRAQPFKRDAIGYFSEKAASSGDVESLFQFEERKVATSRAHEKGKLYFKLATFADLEPQFKMRGPTFWKIAGTSQAGYPPVIFNNLEELIRQRDFSGAALLLTDSIGFMPRYLYPEVHYVASRLYLLAGDFKGYSRMVEAMVGSIGWDEGLMLSLAGEAMDGIGDGELAVKIFGALLNWHCLSPQVISYARFIFKLADKDSSLRAGVVSHFRCCIDRPFPHGPEETEELRDVEAFFEDTGEYLRQWGQYADAVRCIERSLLIAGEKGERAGKLFRLAEVYRDMGAQGVEGLLLTVYRLRRDGAEAGRIEEYLKALGTSLGINLQDDAGLRSVLMRSVFEEDYKWADLVMAGFSSWFSGDLRRAVRYAVQGHEKHPDVIEVGLFAALCYENLEEWREAAGLYRDIGEKAGGPKEAARLLKRASLIVDIKLGREKEALQLLARALQFDPEDDNLFHEVESRAVKLEEKAIFIKAHEFVEGHLPGRQTQRAFYYKYAKDMEEIFGDLDKASKILLQALTLAPRKGPVLDSIGRVSRRMQKFQPISQAAAVLKLAGVPREDISSFIMESVNGFFADENLPSAYGLMNECVEWDPGLDIVDGVRQLPLQGPSGVAMARKLLDRWITALEAAITQHLEDPDYVKRIDALSDMRDILIETSESGEDRRQTVPPGSIPPPSIDRGWDEMAAVSDSLSDEEITLEMFPRVDIMTRRLMKERDFGPPPPVEKSVAGLDVGDLPKVIIDLPPEELKAIANIERITEGSLQEEITRVMSAEPAKAEIVGPSFSAGKVTEIIESIGRPEVVEPKVIIDASSAARKPAGRDGLGAPGIGGPGAPVAPVAPETVALGEPAPPVALQPSAAEIRERKDSVSVEVTIVSRTEEDAGRDVPGAPAAPRPAAAATLAEAIASIPPKQAIADQEPDAAAGSDAHGAPVDRMAPATSAAPAAPPSEGAPGGPAPHARPAAAVAAHGPASFVKPPPSAESVLPPPEPAPAGAARPPAKAPAARPGAKVAARKVTARLLKGEAALADYAEQPWELDRVPALLQMSPQQFGNRSSLFLLKGIHSLFDSAAAKFSIKDYRLIGKSGTARTFSALAAEGVHQDWFEVLELLWDHAPSLAIERLSDYGVSVADQITPFSSGPVAPVIERAIRALGYVRASVYSKRERKMQIDAVRTNPPSVVVLLPLGRIPPSLDYSLGKILWGAASRRILAYTLPVDEGDKIMEAAVEAFGRPSRRDKLDPLVSSIVQDVWQIVPPKVQERLRGMIQGMTRIDFAEIKKASVSECVKAGFLFSGDLMSSLRDFLPSDMLSSIERDVPRDLLSGIVKESEDICRFIRFALSPEVQEFMNDFVL